MLEYTLGVRNDRSYIDKSAMKSSGASGVRPIRRAGRSGGKSIFERTDADLEAANTLVLFSKKPIHFNRRASADNQSVPKCIDGLPSSVTGQPSRKRVRVSRIPISASRMQYTDCKSSR